MQRAKETVANVAASAKAGVEKGKATMREKVEQMSAHDPIEKNMARERKEERKAQAELEKQEVKEHNGAARLGARATGGQGHQAMSAEQKLGTAAGEEGAKRTHPGVLPSNDDVPRRI